MKRNCRDDGCSCVFDEDGETQLAWCKIHAAMRDRIRELEQRVSELETEVELYRYEGNG